jgi:uncharacterized paraquat-inducible protein A
MSDTDELKKRAEKAAQIIGEPDKFKVCEGCESIVTLKANTCPNCHGYRFDGSAERVILQAKILGARAATSVLPKDFE